MPMTKDDFLTTIRQRVQDEDAASDRQLDNDEYESALRAAVVRFSRDRPAVIVADVVSVGGSALPLPANYDEEIGCVVSVEHPVGELPPSLLDNGGYDWSTLRMPSGFGVWLRQGYEEIDAGETVRVTYKGLHVVDATENTVPVIYFDAVCDWAASILCHDLAALYSNDSDSTITADSVDHNGRNIAWSARGNKLAKRYLNALGLDEKRCNAAGEVVSWSASR